MELEELADRINNIKQMELLASKPATPFDPSEGMDNLNEAKDYIRFLYNLLQEKEKLNQDMASDLKVLREELSAYRQKTEKEHDAYVKIMSQFARQNETLYEATQQISRLNALVVKLTEQLEVQKKHRYGGHGYKKKRSNAQDEVLANNDRTQEKDDFDGENCVKPADNEDLQDVSRSDKEKHISGKDENRLGSKYNTMCADEVVVHKSDESQIPTGSILLRKYVRKSFDQIVKIVEHDYEILVYMDKGGKIHEAYLPATGEPSCIDKFPGTHASAGFLANLAFSKYVLCTPFYREMNRILASKMSTCRQTLINWIRKGASFLEKLSEKFKDLLFSEDGIINCDETWERLILTRGKKGYLWCFVNRIARIVMFYYDSGSRSRASLQAFIGDRKIKALQSDGYNVYMYLDNEVIDAEHLCCMAHAKVKFQAALDQGKSKEAEYILYLIGRLYELERRIRDKSYSEIQAARNSIETRKIKERLVAEVNRLLVSRIGQSDTLLGKAVRYFHHFEKQLFAYMKDGRYTIDNLIAERAIRPFTVERNNAPTFCSHKGVEVSALYHTVIETCKLQGYSVLDYLTSFFTAVIQGRTDYENMMPGTIGIGKMK